MNITPGIVTETFRSAEECPLCHGPARVEELDRAARKKGGHVASWAWVWCATCRPGGGRYQIWKHMEMSEAQRAGHAAALRVSEVPDLPAGWPVVDSPDAPRRHGWAA